MREYPQVYDLYLHMQAEMSFRQELALYQFEDFESARTILDVGCGNASYARLLAIAYPDKQIVGIDPDAALLQCGRSRSMPANLRLLQGTVVDLPRDLNPDVMICRLVSMYLSDPLSLACWAADHLKHAIVIDAADDLFTVTPPMPLFAATETANEERIRRMGGDRSIVNRVEEIWESVGFRVTNRSDILVQSTAPTARLAMHHMVRLHAELAVGNPLTPELIEEIFAWSLHPGAYLHYGLRTRRFSMLQAPTVLEGATA